MMVSRTTLPDVDNDVVRRVLPNEDLVSTFCSRAEAVGMHVRRVRKGDIGPQVKQCLAEVVGGKRGKVLLEPGIDTAGVILAALDGSADCLEPTGDNETLFGVDAAITGVAGAVAETGTLICERGPHRRCQTSLVPPVHIAVVPVLKILPDLLDLFRDASGITASSNVSLITGPSKTADIEGILITGVHGPRHVYVLVLED